MEENFENQPIEQPAEQQAEQPVQEPAPAPQQPVYQVPQQPVQYAQPQPAQAENPGKGMSIAALVLGILGLVGGWIPVVQYFTGVCSILAIIFGIIGRKKSTEAGQPTGMATTGMVLGIVAVAITILASVICAGVCAAAGAAGLDSLGDLNNF